MTLQLGKDDLQQVGEFWMPFNEAVIVDCLIGRVSARPKRRYDVLLIKDAVTSPIALRPFRQVTGTVLATL